jgi:hypothetical protein
MILVNALNAASVSFIVRKDASGRTPRGIFRPICSGAKGAAFAVKNAQRK